MNGSLPPDSRKQAVRISNENAAELSEKEESLLERLGLRKDFQTALGISGPQRAEPRAGLRELWSGRKQRADSQCPRAGPGAGWERSRYKGQGRYKGRAGRGDRGGPARNSRSRSRRWEEMEGGRLPDSEGDETGKTGWSMTGESISGGNC